MAGAQELKDLITSKVDARKFYGEALGWEGVGNARCPFSDRHDAGEDSAPSLSIGEHGECFCHGCQYKASSPIGFYEDFKGVSFKQACADLYSAYVEPLVPAADYRGPAKALQANAYIMCKLRALRGITAATAKRRQLGWVKDRLTIPVFNEYGFCVNVRRYDLLKVHKAKFMPYADGWGKPRLWPLDSLASGFIIFLEGEPDTLLALQMGFSAITTTGGAGSWDPSWGALFKGKRVVIFPDNDKAGESGAESKRQALAPYAKAVAVCKLPVKEPKEDFTDWALKYGGSAEKGWALAKQALASAAESLPAAERVGEADAPAAPELDGALRGTLSQAEQVVLQRALAVSDYLAAKGRFFKNEQGELFYSGDGNSSIPMTYAPGMFLSFLARLSPVVNSASSAGRFVIQHVLNRAHATCSRARTGSWALYDGHAIYVAKSADKLLKLERGRESVIPNAVNDDKILLELPLQEMAFKFDPDASIGGGLRMLWDRVAVNMAACDSDRYLILCWLLGLFMREYVKPKPLLRLLARTAWGKTTAVKLLSLLVYGREALNHSATTNAASYEMASRYPLMIFDNIETRNMTDALEDFMLIVATGGLKAKRKQASDTGLVVEHANCLLISNGIEPLKKHELTSRTLEIGLDVRKFGRRGFNEVAAFKALLAGRSHMLSAIMRLLRSHVLPKVADGLAGKLAAGFGQHSKERFNEYLGLMAVMLRAVWGYLPCKGFKHPDDMVAAWFSGQNAASKDQDTGTNDVLYFLETFVDRRPQLAEARVAVGAGPDGEDARLKATTRELLSDFRILARHLGIRCPWDNERQLGTRLADADQILAQAGWSRSYAMITGKRVYTYAKLPGGKEAAYGAKRQKARAPKA